MILEEYFRSKYRRFGKLIKNRLLNLVSKSLVSKGTRRSSPSIALGSLQLFLRAKQEILARFCGKIVSKSFSRELQTVCSVRRRSRNGDRRARPISRSGNSATLIFGPFFSPLVEFSTTSSKEISSSNSVRDVPQFLKAFRNGTI